MQLLLLYTLFCDPELLLLGSLCAVLGTALVTVCNALCVQRTADDVVTNTGEVTYTAASDKDDGVLLKVVSDAGDIGGCLDTVGQTDSRDLTQSGVRLLRGSRGNLGANASLLRVALVRHRVGQRVEAMLKNGSLGLVLLIAAALSDELVKGWHCLFVPPSLKI